MDLFFREVADRIGEDDVLFKIDMLLEWPAFSPILKRGLDRSGVGPQGYDPLVLFRCLLIGQWHGLCDPKLGRALKVRLDFMLFCGLDLHAPVPHETTHCRFRVEQCSGTMKRWFGLYRACYFGVDKTHAQLALAAIAQNLLKATNKITLSPQIPTIA
ncbi:MAG: transposase [Pseudoprimorskyibacter sp.]|nr:transposase [Pseudoprimorskyibacter sp.]